MPYPLLGWSAEAIFFSSLPI